MNQLINSRSGKRIHGAWYLAYLIFLLISLPVTGQENTQLPEGQQTVNISGGKIWYHVIGEGHKLPVLSSTEVLAVPATPYMRWQEYQKTGKSSFLTRLAPADPALSLIQH